TYFPWAKVRCSMIGCTFVSSAASHLADAVHPLYSFSSVARRISHRSRRLPGWTGCLPVSTRDLPRAPFPTASDQANGGWPAGRHRATPSVQRLIVARSSLVPWLIPPWFLCVGWAYAPRFFLGMLVRFRIVSLLTAL